MASVREWFANYKTTDGVIRLVMTWTGEDGELGRCGWGGADRKTMWAAARSRSVMLLVSFTPPAGKPVNKFAFNGEAKDEVFATDTIIAEMHDAWKVRRSARSMT